MDRAEETGKPLLLLDVDGVLIPYAAPSAPAGFVQYNLLGEQVWLSPRHGAWLRPLCKSFELVWATGWEHEANHLIGPILGLPPLRVVEFARDAVGRFTKLPTIVGLVGEHPLVWIDDELSAEAHAWAAERQVPTLLVDADPAVGLTYELVQAAGEFTRGTWTHRRR